MDRGPRTRRTVLRSSVPVVAALAGCSITGTSESPDAGDPATETDDAETPAAGDDDETDGGQDETRDDGSGETDLDDLSLSGEELAIGLRSPVAAVPVGDQVLVVDQPGAAYPLEDGLADEPYLDISDRVVDLDGFSERGLLGVAPHPDYPETGRLFVRYSAPPREGTPDDYSHTFVLSEFEAGPEGADTGSERVLLEIPEPQPNHNAGDLAFGPDGYLYVTVGDGGGSGDQGSGHVEDWYDPVSGGNGQDVTENLLGSVLRIDVDGGGDAPYVIPEDNPLVGEEGLDEHYAWGFRNPWQLSFGPEGRLFVADVGEQSYEEINLVERGGNYGWNVREGSQCFQREECPTETPDGDPLIDPIVEYPREGAEVSGISVIGGFVYQGESIQALRGRYVFGDWAAEGEVFVATEDGGGEWETIPVPVDNIGSRINAFGRDTDGELLVCTTESGRVDGEDGAVYRLVPA